MLVHENLGYHNVTELEAGGAHGGLCLRRYPAAVRHKLGDRGRFISEEATGSELRFVTEAGHVRVTVGAHEQECSVYVYKGGLFHSEHRIPAGVLRTLHLEEPAARFAMVDRERLQRGSGFAPEIWRVGFGRSTGVFAGINTFGYEVRPPAREETPGLRWLAYGSSITHGLDDYHLSYAHQAARRLGADVMNAGLGGSCLCEPEVADWLAERRDWDMLTLELGVNMRDGISDESFRERVGYLLERVLGSHPDKPVFLITIYPNFATYAGNGVTEKDRRFNEILREHAERLSHPRLHLIEGADVMDDMGGMSCDLIHPGPYGHIRMGERLADQMNEILKKEENAGCT